MNDRRDAIKAILGLAATVASPTSLAEDASILQRAKELKDWLEKQAGKVNAAGRTAVGEFGDIDDGGFNEDSIKVFTAIIRGFDDCLKYRISGICFKKVLGVPIPVGFKITHYLPTALIELTKGPMDSIFYNVGPGSHGAYSSPAGSSLTLQAHSFDARVWRIDDQLRAFLTLGISECAMCGDRSAGTDRSTDLSELSDIQDVSPEDLDQSMNAPEPTGIWWADRGKEKPKVNLTANQKKVLKQIDSLSSAAACALDPYGFSSAVIEMLNGKFIGDLPLLYTSEIDQGQWRKGCRDLVKTMVSAPQAMWDCGIKDVADSGINSLSEIGPVDAAMQKLGWSDAELPSFGQATGMTDLCVPGLGPLYPRTGRAHGYSEIAAATITAYRAMHLAKNDLKSYGGRVSPNDRLQPAYPSIANCYTAGMQNVSGQWNYDNVMSPSKDGRYAYIWWTPVSCCYGFDVVPRCLKLITGASSIDPSNLEDQILGGF